MTKIRMYIIICLAFLLSSGRLCAQSDILVIGKVSSTVDDGPMAGVEIYGFKTVGAGEYEYERAKLMYEAGYVPEGLVINAMSRQDGEYEITIPAYGSLIFYRHPFKPVFVKVRGKNRHDVVIEATHVLADAMVVEEGKKRTQKGKVVGYGNKFTVKNFPYFFDKELIGEVEGVGKTNSRLVTQVFLTTADGKDTLRYFSPRVYDGEQYHSTQYHWRKDILYDIADTLPRFDASRDSVMFNLTFRVEHPEELYFCKANIWVEDYIKTYYRDTVELLNTGRVSRPFQFLEYSFASESVDPEQYFKHPRREMIATPKNMKLKFRVESAQLDMSDRGTADALNSLKKELRGICADAASTLKEIHFRGLSSPEGPYEKNLDLSQKRTRTVMNDILSSLPSSVLPRIYKSSEGSVASWSDVADVLEADGLISEAEVVREAVRLFPDDIAVQGWRIRTSDCYKSRIAPRLEELRVVRCEYIAEVSRYLSPEEILERYTSDEDYRTGEKDLTLNEYWHLFQLIQDKDELESLYRRALKDSYKAEREYWTLPANNLAQILLEKKQADTLLLSPFINENRPVDYSEMDVNTGIRRTINDKAVVANQVLMHMLGKNYSRAEELSSLIAESHPMLRSIVRCVGGYLDLENEEDIKLVEQISESSLRNKAIINLYAERYDSTTVSALNALPLSDPVTPYLKAQRLCLQYFNQDALMRGAEFNRDEDPHFRHPDDREIPAATEQELEAMRKSIASLEEEAAMYRDLGLIDEVAMVQRDIDKSQALLQSMENSEPAVDPAPCSVYEAAAIYLKECFAMDGRFVLTAKADADINEVLLNDVLGIKLEKK